MKTIYMNENSAILLGRFLFLDFYYSVSPIAQGGGRGIFGGEIKKVQKKFAQVSKSL